MHRLSETLTEFADVILFPQEVDERVGQFGGFAYNGSAVLEDMRMACPLYLSREIGNGAVYLRADQSG